MGTPIPPLSPDHIMQIGYAYRATKALLSAVDLKVFTQLSAGPLELDALRMRTGVHERGARDFFDALVALRLLTRDPDGRYANTAETAHYLDKNKPSYLGAELEFINAQLYAAWTDLTPALTTGLPQRGSGGSNYPDRYKDPAARSAFAGAMTAATRPAAQALAVKFAWRNYRTIADIGTAAGCLLAEIVVVHPHLTGTGFDLPALKPEFDSYVHERGLSDRLTFEPGDFFHDSLPRAEVLVMGRVLHNWDTTTKKMLLKKAYDALPPKGALIVYERMIDDERRVNATALLSSLNMLLMTSGGFDFTASECIGWMRDTGFRDVHAKCLADEQLMVVGVK
jgi:hypothetical protein